MMRDTKAEGLRAAMSEHGLTYADVAGLCCVSVKTVESWLAAQDSAMYRAMASRHLLLLSHALPGFLGKRRTAAKAAARKGKA
jgi:hypothetical protein